MSELFKIAKSSWNHWKEITFIYFVQLILGIVIGLTFSAAMCGAFDQSMVLDQLAKGFDRTVIMDVLHTNSTILDSTKSIAISLAGIYLLISIFLQGGWLANMKQNQFSIRSMIRNGIQYYLPFLGIAIISILFIGVFAAVFGVGFTKIVGDPLVTFSSEKPYVLWIITLICFFILWSILVWSWSVSSRFQYIEGNSFFTSLKLGFKKVWNKKLGYLAIGLLLVGIHVVLMFLYYFIMGDRGAPSWGIIILGILVQQIFAFVRIAIRGFGYSMIKDLNSK